MFAFGEKSGNKWNLLCFEMKTKKNKQNSDTTGESGDDNAKPSLFGFVGWHVCKKIQTIYSSDRLNPYLLV